MQGNKFYVLQLLFVAANGILIFVFKAGAYLQVFQGKLVLIELLFSLSRTGEQKRRWVAISDDRP